MKAASPLRYPGGKWRLQSFFAKLIELNFDQPPVYLEPYAGGASLALSLLLEGLVERIALNDLDKSIHAFWRSVLDEPDKVIRFIQSVPLTTAEWARQRAIYNEGLSVGRLKLGLATLYLNRTNHSGILNAGMIGGKKQKGEWKLDARFNRVDLEFRVRRVASLRRKISLLGNDALGFIASRPTSNETLIYLDPPYYRAGPDLYLNAYEPDDHADVRDAVIRLRCPWVVSYDDVRATRKLYEGISSRRLTLLHTARVARQGHEVMFFSPRLRIPRTIQ